VLFITLGIKRDGLVKSFTSYNLLFVTFRFLKNAPLLEGDLVLVSGANDAPNRNL